MPFASPVGLTNNPSGPAARPASRSAPQDGKKDETMPDTSPPILSIWSGSVAPECCLANRSPARKSSESLQSRLDATLARRLNGRGSTIYQTAWKRHVTPLGRTISRLRASALRTSDSEHTSEPFRMSGWSTAASRDWKDTAGMKVEAVNPDGTTRIRLDQLPRQAQLMHWANAEDSMRFTASGETLTGSSAEMSGGGRLNPEHSRWLMGYPAEWHECSFTVTAMPSTRGRRKNSSKPSLKPSAHPTLPLLTLLALAA